MKQNKQIYIDFILSQLNKGNVKYNDVCLLFCTKFDLTKQSFNKYWKIADESHKQQREVINKEKLNTTIEAEKEALKMNILSKFEGMEILTEIAKGKPKKVEGVIVMPNHNERINAIKTLATFQGWEAPKETKNTNMNIENPTINFIYGD